jgi:hypothetical protein
VSTFGHITLSLRMLTGVLKHCHTVYGYRQPREGGLQVSTHSKGRPERTETGERDHAIYAEYCSNPAATYRSLGRRFGISHEGVRLIVIRIGLEGARSSRRELQQEIDRERLHQRFAASATEARPCVVCGSWVLRGRGASRTCSSCCAEAYRTSSVRNVVDQGEWLKHRASIARYLLRKGTPVQKRHARRVLSGRAAVVGRWHVPGSTAAEVVGRLCPEKLPPAPGGHAEGEHGR